MDDIKQTKQTGKRPLINNQTLAREKHLTGPYTEGNPKLEVRALIIVVFINISNDYFLYLPQ